MLISDILNLIMHLDGLNLKQLCKSISDPLPLFIDLLLGNNLEKEAINSIGGFIIIPIRLDPLEEHKAFLVHLSHVVIILDLRVGHGVIVDLTHHRNEEVNQDDEDVNLCEQEDYIS